LHENTWHCVLIGAPCCPACFVRCGRPPQAAVLCDRANPSLPGMPGCACEPEARNVATIRKHSWWVLTPICMRVVGGAPSAQASSRKPKLAQGGRPKRGWPAAAGNQWPGGSQATAGRPNAKPGWVGRREPITRQQPGHSRQAQCQARLGRPPGTNNQAAARPQPAGPMPSQAGPAAGNQQPSSSQATAGRPKPGWAGSHRLPMARRQPNHSGLASQCRCPPCRSKGYVGSVDTGPSAPSSHSGNNRVDFVRRSYLTGLGGVCALPHQ
jgi:hypothetical protein